MARVSTRCRNQAARMTPTVERAWMNISHREPKHRSNGCSYGTLCA
jgi:hypothetical protein